MSLPSNLPGLPSVASFLGSRLGAVLVIGAAIALLFFYGPGNGPAIAIGVVVSGVLAAVFYVGVAVAKRRMGKQVGDAIEGMKNTISAVDNSPQARERVAKIRAKWEEEFKNVKPRYLKEKPVLLLVGESGSGKSVLLEQSGVEEESSNRERGDWREGTENVDPWFFPNGLVLDTAGEMVAPQAGGSRIDWLEMIKLLKRTRPRNPVSGVVLAVPLWRLTDAEDGARAAQAKLFQSEFYRLVREFGVRFPVSVVVTMADLIDGYPEFATRQNAGKPGDSFTIFGWPEARLNDEFSPSSSIQACLDGVSDRLNAQTLYDTCCPDVPAVDGVDALRLWLFPANVRSVGARLGDYLRTVFREKESERLANSPFFRGIFFGSAIQTISKAKPRRNEAKRPGSSPFHIRDLLELRLFGEAGLVTTSPRAEAAARRRRVFGIGVPLAIAAIAIAVVVLAGAAGKEAGKFETSFVSLNDKLGGYGKWLAKPDGAAPAWIEFESGRLQAAIDLGKLEQLRLDLEGADAKSLAPVARIFLPKLLSRKAEAMDWVYDQLVVRPVLEAIRNGGLEASKSEYQTEKLEDGSGELTSRFRELERGLEQTLMLARSDSARPGPETIPSQLPKAAAALVGTEDVASLQNATFPTRAGGWTTWTPERLGMARADRDLAGVKHVNALQSKFKLALTPRVDAALALEKWVESKSPLQDWGDFIGKKPGDYKQAYEHLDKLARCFESRQIDKIVPGLLASPSPNETKQQNSNEQKCLKVADLLTFADYPRESVLELQLKDLTSCTGENLALGDRLKTAASAFEELAFGMGKYSAAVKNWRDLWATAKTEKLFRPFEMYVEKRKTEILAAAPSKPTMPKTDAAAADCWSKRINKVDGIPAGWLHLQEDLEGIEGDAPRWADTARAWIAEVKRTASGWKVLKESADPIEIFPDNVDATNAVSSVKTAIEKMTRDRELFKDLKLPPKETPPQPRQDADDARSRLQKLIVAVTKERHTDSLNTIVSLSRLKMSRSPDKPEVDLCQLPDIIGKLDGDEKTYWEEFWKAALAAALESATQADRDLLGDVSASVVKFPLSLDVATSATVAEVRSIAEAVLRDAEPPELKQAAGVPGLLECLAQPRARADATSVRGSEIARAINVPEGDHVALTFNVWVSAMKSSDLVTEEDRRSLTSLKGRSLDEGWTGQPVEQTWMLQALCPAESPDHPLQQPVAGKNYATRDSPLQAICTKSDPWSGLRLVNDLKGRRFPSANQVAGWLQIPETALVDPGTYLFVKLEVTWKADKETAPPTPSPPNIEGWFKAVSSPSPSKPPAP